MSPVASSNSAASGLALTRASLYYLCTYLILTGLALMTAPSLTLRLLWSSGPHDDAMTQFAGILMLALGLLVSQVVRWHVSQIYATTIAIRMIIWTYVAWLLWRSGDAFFAVVLVVVGIGILLTASAYLFERHGAPMP